MPELRDILICYLSDDGVEFQLNGELALGDLGYVPSCYAVDTFVHEDDGDEVDFWIVAPHTFQLNPMDILIASELAKIWLSEHVK